MFLRLVHKVSSYLPKKEWQYRKLSLGEFYELFNQIAIEKEIFTEPIDCSDGVFVEELELGTVGQFKCKYNTNGEPYGYTFGFTPELLDGKSYPLHEIRNVILHELCHMLANCIHKDNCEHDDRWIETCNNLGYTDISFDGCSLMQFTMEKIEKDNVKKFTLRCSHCNRIIYESDIFDYNAILLFVIEYFMSGATSNIKLYGNIIPLFSYCCHSAYYYEFESKSLYKGLELKGELPQIQEEILQHDKDAAALLK